MANGHGGKRKGSGRKSTKHEYVDDGLESPLEFLLKQMRNTSATIQSRIDCASKAIPYTSARLQSITAEVDGDININLISQLDHDSDT